MVGRMFELPDENVETLYKVRGIVLDTLDALREVRDIFNGQADTGEGEEKTEFKLSRSKEINYTEGLFGFSANEVGKFETARSMALDVMYALREIRAILAGQPYDEDQIRAVPIKRPCDEDQTK